MRWHEHGSYLCSNLSYSRWLCQAFHTQIPRPRSRCPFGPPDSFPTRDAKWYLKVSFWLLCFSLWHSILVLQRRMAIRCADDTELFLID